VSSFNVLLYPDLVAFYRIDQLTIP